MYLVECKPDEVLLISLTQTSRKNIRHSGNKTELLKKLAERYGDTIGIIDEDPESIQPPHLQKFKEKQDVTSCKIKILHQKSKNNTLIILRPKLEDWVLEAAKETNINPERYNLPNNPTELHKQINIQIDKFQKMVENLRTKSKRLKELKAHLQTKDSTKL